MFSLSKAPRLAPGQGINLSKAGYGPKTFYFGGRWGAIQKARIFGIGAPKFQKVDLDICAFGYDENGKLISECSYRYEIGSNGHRYAKEEKGDDRGGTTSCVDDGVDNEAISIRTDLIPPNVTDIIFVINSFSKQPFDALPFAGVRIYEGSLDMPTIEHCTVGLANDGNLVGKKTLIVGSLYRTPVGDWDFKAIGETRTYSDIRSFLKEVSRG